MLWIARQVCCAHNPVSINKSLLLLILLHVSYHIFIISGTKAINIKNPSKSRHIFSYVKIQRVFNVCFLYLSIHLRQLFFLSKICRKFFYLAFMFLRILPVSNSNRQNIACIYFFFSQFSLKSQCISLFFNLTQCGFRSVTNL